MRKLLSVILSITMLLTMSTAVFADGIDGPMQPAKIKVGINAQFPPFEYYNENGELYGFDIDLMNYIGERIGFEIEYVDMSFDKLIPAVVNGEVTCAISAMTVTEERDSIIDYSRPYLRTTNITFENGKKSRKYGEQYAIVFRDGLESSPYEDLAEPTGDETLYILIDQALKELSNDRTVMKLIEKHELNIPMDENVADVEYDAIMGDGDPAAEIVKTFTFEELTNLSVENVEQISINHNEGERIPVTTSSPLMIAKIVDDFKNVQFWRDDSAGGGAGGWIYFINFHMKDGTYIQYGTSLHIDKATYKASNYEDSLKKMAYYYDIINGDDSELKTSSTSNPASDWAKSDIEKAIALNIINIGGNYNFPSPITREEFCELIYNYCANVVGQLVTFDGESNFSDTNNSHILILNAMGIINGKSKTEFVPRDYLTREEAAVILSRMVNKTIPVPVTEMYFNFDDEASISDWASDSIQVMCNMGVMEGTGENKFAPKDTYTTEQAIATIVRVYAAQSANTGIIGGADTPTEIYIGEDAEISDFYIEQAFKHTKKAGQLAGTKEFSMYIGDNEIKANIENLSKTDFEKPAHMYYVSYNIDKVVEYYNKMLAQENPGEEFDIEKFVKLNGFSLAYFANQINGRYGGTTLAATSVLTSREGYIMPKDFENDFGVYLQYEGDYSALVTFNKIGEGVIEARMQFVRNGEKADMLMFISEIYDALGEECITIGEIK